MKDKKYTERENLKGEKKNIADVEKIGRAHV